MIIPAIIPITPAAMIAPVLSDFLMVGVLSDDAGFCACAGGVFEALTVSEATASNAFLCDGVTASGASEIRRNTAPLHVSFIFPPSETHVMQAMRSSGRRLAKALVPEYAIIASRASSSAKATDVPAISSVITASARIIFLMIFIPPF